MGFSWAKVHGSDFLRMGSEDKCYQPATLVCWDVDPGGVAFLGPGGLSVRRDLTIGIT